MPAYAHFTKRHIFSPYIAGLPSRLSAFFRLSSRKSSKAPSESQRMTEISPPVPVGPDSGPYDSGARSHYTETGYWELEEARGNVEKGSSTDMDAKQSSSSSRT